MTFRYTILGTQDHKNGNQLAEDVVRVSNLPCTPTKGGFQRRDHTRQRGKRHEVYNTDSIYSFVCTTLGKNPTDVHFTLISESRRHNMSNVLPPPDRVELEFTKPIVVTTREMRTPIAKFWADHPECHIHGSELNCVKDASAVTLENIPQIGQTLRQMMARYFPDVENM